MSQAMSALFPWLTAFSLTLGLGSLLAASLRQEEVSPKSAQSFGDVLSLTALLLSFLFLLPPLHPYKGLALFSLLGFLLFFLDRELAPPPLFSWMTMLLLSLLLPLYFIPLTHILRWALSTLLTLSIFVSLHNMVLHEPLAERLLIYPGLSFLGMGLLSHNPMLTGLAALFLGVTTGASATRQIFRKFALGEAALATLWLYLVFLSLQFFLKSAFFLNLWIVLLLFGFPFFSVGMWTSRKEGLLSLHPFSVRDLLSTMGMREKDADRSATLLLAYFCVGTLLLFSFRQAPIFPRFLFALLWSLLGIMGFFLLSLYILLHSPPKKKSGASVLGYTFFGGSRAELIEKLDLLVASHQPHMVITPDSSALYLAQFDSEYRGILQKASLLIPDGMGVYFTARLFQEPIKERIAGIDCLHLLCEQAAKKKYRVFLYGGKPNVAKRAAEKLQALFPGLPIVGALDGYSPQEGMVLETIQKAAPDILFVALGVPKQEKWMAKNREKLSVSLSMGVGGSFDVIAGVLKRAPLWMQNAGLEWLFRLLQEPWRIRRAKNLLPFFWIVLKEKLRSSS